MKTKITLIVWCLFCAVLTCSAQKIKTEKTLGGYKFSQNGKVLKMNQLAAKVSGDFEARQLMRSAKSKIALSSVLSFSGGFILGYTIANVVRGKETNLLFPAAGVILAGASFPLGNKGYKQAKKAVGIYNDSIEKPTGTKFKSQFEMVASPKGIGLLVRF